jgi:hypothetical protein
MATRKRAPRPHYSQMCIRCDQVVQEFLPVLKGRGIHADTVLVEGGDNEGDEIAIDVPTKDKVAARLIFDEWEEAYMSDDDD